MSFQGIRKYQNSLNISLLSNRTLVHDSVSKNKVSKAKNDKLNNSSLLNNQVYVYIANKRVYAKYVFNNKKDAEMCEGIYYKNGSNVSKLS